MGQIYFGDQAGKWVRTKSALTCWRSDFTGTCKMCSCCAATQIACASIASVLSRSKKALTCWAGNSLTSCLRARIVLAQ